MFNIPTEYQALVIYVIFIFLIFVGALIWNRYYREIKKRIPLADYGQKDDQTPKATTNRA